jgi:hypothetical protein
MEIMIVDRIKKLVSRIRYYYYAKKYYLKNQMASMWQMRVKPRLFFVGVTLYSACLLLITLFLLNFLGAHNLQTNMPVFLMSVGAMLGGILAIIFSFGTLLMQNAASSSSAGFYNIVGRDHALHVICWILTLIIIYCFGLSIALGQVDVLNENVFIYSILVSFAFFLIGISFLLLYVVFRRTFRRINPFANINLIQKEAYEYIAKVSKVAKDLADLSLKQPDLPAGYDRNKALAVSYQFVRPQIAAIGTRLNYLFDFHDKLASQKEQEFAKYVLNTAYNILLEYMRQRNNSSIILPDNDIFFAGVSDSQDFLAPQLENLLNRGKAYIRENNDNGATHVIRIMCNLVLLSAEMKYITEHHDNNPILSQCRGYLDQLTEFALGQKAFEASFQCAGAYLKICPVVCQKQMSLEVRSITNTMSNLCISSLLSNQDVVWGRGMDVCVELLRGLIQKFSYDLKIQIESFFTSIINVILISHKSQIIKGPLVGMNNQLKLDIFFRTVIEESGKVLNDLDDAQKKDASIHKLQVVAEAYRGFLRKLSEEIKTADTLMMQTIYNSIADIGNILLYASSKTDDDGDKQELLKQAGWFIYQPGWFFHHAPKVCSGTAYDALVDAPAKIGLYAVELNEGKIAKDAIDAISQVANDIFEKEGGECIYGYTPPRTMETACYIGIYALKNKLTAVVDQLKQQLDKFQEKYEKETISKLPSGKNVMGPRKDQICHELLRLRDELSEIRSDRLSRHIMDRASDRLLDKIELIDLDRFIYAIWKTWVEGSPIEAEIGNDKDVQIIKRTRSFFG